MTDPGRQHDGGAPRPPRVRPASGAGPDRHRRARELARENARLRQSNRELTRFADVLAHELRLPLRLLLDELGQAEDGLEPGRGREELGATRERLQRLDEQIAGLKELLGTLATPPPRTPVAMRDVVDDALALLHRQLRPPGVDVQVGDLPTVRGDREQLTMLVRNLVQNAVRQAPGPGAVVEVHGQPLADWHSIAVVDHGPGLDPEQARRAFTLLEPLQSTPARSGLGLIVCGRIVARHGGLIWVERPAAGGTAVRFTLPS